MRFLSIVFIAFFVLFGCSSKKHFEPKNISGKMIFENKLSAPIVSSNRNGAVLADSRLISFKDGISQITLDENYKFLNQSAQKYVLQEKCGDILIIESNTNNTQKINYDKCVLSATLDDNKLAMVLVDNTIVFYDITKQNAIFSQKFNSVVAINSQLASPVITKKYVIFPDLEGKLFVYDKAQNKIIKDILISSDKFFNNVIYLYVRDNYMLAASAKRISAIVNDKPFKYDIELRDIAFINNNIYVLSVEGEILEFDYTLRLLRKVKLPFAVLNGIVIKDDVLYSIEKGGFIVKLPLNSFIPEIYTSNLKKQKIIFYNANSIFYDRFYKDF